jgi:hypothetical protein
VVFFHAPSKLAIVGDVLFAGSIGRTDFPRGDHQILIASIRDLKLWPLGNDVEFISGHGPMSTFGEERRSNPFVADGCMTCHQCLQILPRRRLRPGTHRHRGRPAEPQGPRPETVGRPVLPDHRHRVRRAHAGELIDSDNDGHIRAPELLAAIDWAAARLNDSVSVFEQKLAGVPLAAIQDEAVLAAARGLLPEGGESRGQRGRRQRRRSRILGARPGRLGSRRRRCPAAGRRIPKRPAPTLADVREKLDDFFVRCRLAAFDVARRATTLNASDDAASRPSRGAALSATAHADIAALPLARVGAGATVPLGAGIDSGINPAWASRIGGLSRSRGGARCSAPAPRLSESDWLAVQDQLAVYGSSWQAAKPAGLPPEAEAVRDLERLARYVRDLLPLANNFVAFRDFYTRQGKACIPDRHALPRRPRRRTGASPSPTLPSTRRWPRCRASAWCIATACAMGPEADHRRRLHRGRFGPVDGLAQRRLLRPPGPRLGRHDHQDRRPPDQPAPGLLVALQEARAHGRRTTAEDRREQGQPASRASSPKPPPRRRKRSRRRPQPSLPQHSRPFDVGKFAGIFAAIGLAVGAIGTAVGLHGHRHARPQVAGRCRWSSIGLMLLISGPAVIVAWFKLQQPQPRAHPRCQRLGGERPRPHQHPLRHFADADWRNCRREHKRALTDPYAEKERPWKTYAVHRRNRGVVALAWWTSR